MLTLNMSRCAMVALTLGAAGWAQARPNTVIDGRINPVAEGYVLLTEAATAGPISGGSTTTSDAVAETATFHWWNGLALTDVPMFDNRGDVINIYVRPASEGLYVALAGPTAPFNSFNDQGALASGDRGDLFIAIDSPAIANVPTDLTASSGHKAFGSKAVDFAGWVPDTIIGVQYVNNGGGGTGRCVVQSTTPGAAPTSLIDVGQGVPAGVFLWNALIEPNASYDTHNRNAGEFEFLLPWSFLGYPSRPLSATGIRIAAYVTQNFESDVYDSAPGVGNGTVFEELGDCPGDPDVGGLLAACNPGSNFGSTAGSDAYGGSFDVVPGPDTECDTLSAYLTFGVPARCRGDADFDGDIDFTDIVTVLSFFGFSYAGGTGLGDADNGGDVNFADVTTVLSNFTLPCP